MKGGLVKFAKLFARESSRVVRVVEFAESHSITPWVFLKTPVKKSGLLEPSKNQQDNRIRRVTSL